MPTATGLPLAASLPASLHRRPVPPALPPRPASPPPSSSFLLHCLPSSLLGAPQDACCRWPPSPTHLRPPPPGPPPPHCCPVLLTDSVGAPSLSGFLTVTVVPRLRRHHLRLWPPLIVTTRTHRPSPLSEPLSSQSLLANLSTTLAGAVLSRCRCELRHRPVPFGEVISSSPGHSPLRPSSLTIAPRHGISADFRWSSLAVVAGQLPVGQNSSGQASSYPSCTP